MWEALLGAIVQSMEAAASRIGGAPIVPVGNVFRTFVRSPYPGTDGWLLYLWCCPSPCCGPEPHGQVPSQYGELLSAYVFYKSLTGLSPVGLRQTYYPGADPKIDSAFQYRAQTLTQRWMELHPATGVRQQAAASPLPVRGAHAPALFLLDGSRYTPGAMGARTPGVLVGSDGRFVSASAVRGRHCRVHPEVSAHHP